MRDYIPKIIGQDSFDGYIGPYTGYDPTVDPSASNVFATAAFRFGHATISTVVRRLNESYQTHERFTPLRLHHTFFSPWRIVREGKWSVCAFLPYLTCGQDREPCFCKSLNLNTFMSSTFSQGSVVKNSCFFTTFVIPQIDFYDHAVF